jgi:hypothetical protein
MQAFVAQPCLQPIELRKQLRPTGEELELLLDSIPCIASLYPSAVLASATADAMNRVPGEAVRKLMFIAIQPIDLEW